MSLRLGRYLSEVLVQALLRSCLVAILVVTLVEAPVYGSPSAALGVVLQAQNASVGSGVAAIGATIFNGDTLATDSRGWLRVRLGANQFSLLQLSSAVMRQAPGIPIAVLERGTMAFSSSAAEPFELQASAAHIRPRTGQPVIAQVTIAGPNTLLITSNRGELEVSIGDEVHVVPAMTSYRVEIEPEDQGSGGAAPHKTARSKFVLLLLAMVAAGTGVAVWRATTSPSAP